MAYPILAPNSTWYKSAVSRSTITEINIVDSYSGGTADETWNADADNSGAVKCYRTGTVLTIAGNGSGKIAMNADSSYLFSGSDEKYSALTVINGLALLDASGATTLKCAFDQCGKVTSLDVGGWDTANVTDMERMFQACVSITVLDLSSWNVSKVTTMKAMFLATEAIGIMALTTIGDVSGWDASACTDFEGMFQLCRNLASVDLSGWGMDSAQNVKWMFNHCYGLTSVGDLSGWNTGNITSMHYMFNGCTALESLNVTGWDVSNVTTMRCMFQARSEQYSRYKITGLDTWNPSSCTDMGWMFWGCAGIGTIDVSGWDVSKVENFHHWLCKSSATVIGVENFDVSSCRAFNAMLYGTQNTSYDLSGWDVSNAETLSQLFDNCEKLEEVKGLENWNTSKCRDFGEMFWDCRNLRELDLSSFDTRNASMEWKDPWNGQAGGISRMLGDNNLISLQKITLGENFFFAGDGTDSTPAVLPTPAYDGLWRNGDFEEFAPSDVPDGVRATYYSSPEYIDTDVMVQYGTLFTVAETIRGETGGTMRYTPAEMPGGIRSIREMENALLARTVTEYTNSGAEIVGTRAFQGCTALTRVSLAACTDIDVRAFDGCTALAEAELPALTAPRDYAFAGCTALTKLVLPSLNRTGIYVFQNCTSLEEVDIHKAYSIGYTAFAGCTSLSRLILRRTTSRTILDGSTNGFANTPIGKGTGYIYVPAALIDTYKTSTNWKNFAEQFRALEDYTVDGTVTGELDMEKVG